MVALIQGVDGWRVAGRAAGLLLLVLGIIGCVLLVLVLLECARTGRRGRVERHGPDLLVVELDP